MGECGCNETRPYEILDADGKILVVEIYPGCSYCDTGIMVSLHLTPPDDAQAFDWQPTGKLELDKGQYAQWNYPIMGPDDLVEAAKKLKADEQFGLKGYDSLTDWLEDYGLDLLQTALRLRIEKTRAENARMAQRNKGT
jgi:hypothetical protein